MKGQRTCTGLFFICPFWGFWKCFNTNVVYNYPIGYAIENVQD